MDKRIFILPLLLVSCGRPGDGHESVGAKREWGILQALEANHRGTKTNGIELTESGKHRILSLMASDNETRLWIMLDPASAPFYKQMPPNLNYSISEIDLEKVRTDAEPISSTYQALESHLKSEVEAEQATPLQGAAQQGSAYLHLGSHDDS